MNNREQKEELQALADLISECMGYPTCLKRVDGQVGGVEVKTPDKTVRIRMWYKSFIATDKIPGLVMSPGFGHGEWRYQIVI